jgi:hypothetical protein
MYVDLVQYLHIVDIVVVSLDVIHNLVY